MNTRIANTSDIPALCDLLAILFSQEAEFHPDRERQEAGIRLIIEDSAGGDIMVGELGGRVIGMVNILYTVSTYLGRRVGLVEDMIVHPDFRGHHAGKTILDAAMTHAMQCGCARLTLLTDAANEGAMRFYERFRFTRSTMICLRYQPVN